MTDRYTRILFISAACFNVLAGLPLLLALRPMAALLRLQITPTSTLFIQLVMGLVIIFGWVYWMIACDPLRYRPYIVLGIILKVLFVSVVYGHWLAGNIPWPLPAVAAGDIVYALLFWRYYQGAEQPHLMK